MSDSDSSSLSSAVSTDDEAVAASVNRSIGIDRYFKPKPKKPVEPSSPPPPKRAPSPPHEYVLADNPDIAFIVMFRSRFADAFPKSCPNYGPQDIEAGVTDPIPGDHIERLLCALIGLVLNRKKDVERGHYQRALEEAIQTHSSQWPRSWNGKNPLHGGGSFAAMSPEERLAFLKTLILWALSSSDSVQAILKENYKRSRHEDDLNQPLSVQPWGRDAYKRRYWLIEGQGDTHFRLYRESNPALKHNTWWSVAGTIPELKTIADSLAEEKSQHSKRLSERIHASIPRFEGSEEKRKRRDYRLARKAAFARPEPGFSLYEGRTRGKKLKYTFSDEDDDFSSDAVPSRKSTRFQSRVSTPGEPAGPTYTASGRQVRARVGGAYGESALSGARRDGDEEIANGSSRRTRNSGRTNGFSYAAGYNDIDGMDEDDEPEAASSGNEWDGGDEDANDYGDDDEEMSDAASSVDDELMQQPRSLVVQLRYGKGKQAENAQKTETGTPAPTDNTLGKTEPPQNPPSWAKSEMPVPPPAPTMSIGNITTPNVDVSNGSQEPVKPEPVHDVRKMSIDNITTPNVDMHRVPLEAVKQDQPPAALPQQPMQVDAPEQQQRPPGYPANAPSASPAGVP